MKKALKHTLFALVTLAFAALCAAVLAVAENSRRTLACKEIRAEIRGGQGFIDEDDVKAYVSNYYGTFTGERIDSVDLNRIEKILSRRDAVKKATAWTTDDGVLHISIVEREPAARFEDGSGGGFYADAEGFIFPLKKGVEPPVPLVSGKIPVRAGSGYNGEPSSEGERRWLREALTLTAFRQKNRQWQEIIAGIEVDENGEFTLLPIEGKEKFLIGNAGGLEEKFARIEKYYRYIRPAGEENRYRSVNVKYKDRIICKR